MTMQEAQDVSVPPPEAWLLRCPCCRGGLVYARTTSRTAAIIDWLLQQETTKPVWIVEGTLEWLWEIDYCTCPEACHG